ncbi:MAG: conjugal transfer protein TraR [Treponema sp.]|nr:MAG: conjugal transfer protein TraR [Treponema sp.]
MDQKFIDEMRNKLLHTKKEILAALDQKNDDFKEIIKNDTPKDFADIASSYTDQQILEVMGSQDLKRIQQINSALMRIQDGKYGRCIKCKKYIPEDRLKALPYALKCIACKEADEKKKV